MPNKSQLSPEAYARVLAGNRARQRTRRGARNHAKAIRAYRLRNRLKLVAHNAVTYALRIGKIVPWPCCVLPACKEEKVEAHHPDYTDPLGVIWICGQHHREAHAMVKRR